MRIIFLDIDGVLNSQLYYVNGGKRGGENEIDSKAVGYLNNLIEESGAKVVISSTWRRGRTIEELQQILNNAGFKGEIIGKTPALDGKYSLRGNEIRAWMMENEHVIGCNVSDYKDYVIFDDDSDMLYWQRNNFFWVDPYCGLSPNIIYQAMRFFEGKR